MDCRSVRDLADSFVAEELLTETNHEILRHLDSCPACRAEVADRRRLREAVRTAMERAPELRPRAEFVASLHSTLHAAAVERAGRGRASLRRWLAIAATLLAAAALGFAYRMQTNGAATLAREAAGDHKNCALHFRLAERPIELDEAARRYGTVYRVLERVPPADITTAAGVARVLERHACVYQGRRFAHVVLRYRGEIVSLMVTDGHEESGGRAVMRIDGLNVISFRAGTHVVFIAGDVGAAELTALADTVSGPLLRDLAGA